MALQAVCTRAQSAHELAVEAWRALQHVYGLGVLETPLLRSEPLEAQCRGCRVYLKCEYQQVTGSFKARGAAHALKTLYDDSPTGEPPRVVTASTGNHARAVLHAAAALSAQHPDRPPLHPSIFLPTTADPGKAATLERLGAQVTRSGEDCADTERAAREHAAATGAVYVSPYNDARVAGGQGTIGWELLQQLPRIDVVYVPVGGGGLISGIAAVLKSVHPGVHIVGCQPKASAVMAASVQAGEILQDLPSADTLSGATAGGVEAGSLTFPVVQRLVDEWITVGEREIAEAMLETRGWHGARLEGAAGVALAALLRQAPRLRGQTVVVILSGGNVSDELLQRASSLAATRQSGRQE